MRFRVPQFLDIKNRIFGPLTLRQFLYLAGGAGLSALIWFTIPYTWLSILLIVPIGALAVALAFYEVNKKPFIEVVEAAFYYIISSRLFVWQRREKEAPSGASVAESTEDEKQEQTKPPKVTQGKLKDLTWSLDVSAGARSDDEEE